ncbi:hypothetical protein MA16_Dca019751 [Dendrobium catenatum]|uniref:Uncharacterized protein n=1 Tax=Dendrobium catenatum TaxID=906689 RepID=A0A2I0VQS9_9ASPA|nr:hypothetical protein MA16_Dca019751 [Dendrobium catenatum]
MNMDWSGQAAYTTKVSGHSAWMGMVNRIGQAGYRFGCTGAGKVGHVHWLVGSSGVHDSGVESFDSSRAGRRAAQSGLVVGVLGFDWRLRRMRETGDYLLIGVGRTNRERVKLFVNFSSCVWLREKRRSEVARVPASG